MEELRAQFLSSLPPNGRMTLSIDEVANLLCIGRSSVYEAVRRGQLPSRRLGGRLLVPVPALLDWLGLVDPIASAN